MSDVEKRGRTYEYIRVACIFVVQALPPLWNRQHNISWITTCALAHVLHHALTHVMHDGDKFTHFSDQGQSFFVKVSENTTFGTIKQEHLVAKVSAAQRSGSGSCSNSYWQPPSMYTIIQIDNEQYGIATSIQLTITPTHMRVEISWYLGSELAPEMLLKCMTVWMRVIAIARE